MSRIRNWACLLAVLCTTAVTPAFAGGFGVRESSARSTGRLHTSTARLLSPSTLFFNPAGLTDLNGFQISIDGHALFANFNYEDPNGVHDPINQSGFAVLPGIAMSYGVTPDLVLGLGFNAPYGLTIEWPEDFPGNAVVNRVALQIPHISLGVAYKFSSKFSLGANVNYAPHGLTSVELYRIQGADAETGLTSLLKGTAFGIGGEIGIHVRPTDSLFIGLSYKSRMKVNFKGTGTFTCLGEPCGILPNQDIAADTTMPDEINVGLGVQVDDAWYIAADFGLSVWSVIQEINIELLETPGLSEALELTWKNSYLMRVGAEWAQSDALQIRFGAGYEINPIPDETLSPMLPDADRLVGTVGASFKLGSLPVYADISYLFAHFMERTSTFPDFPATYRTSVHMGGLGLRYLSSP